MYSMCKVTHAPHTDYSDAKLSTDSIDTAQPVWIGSLVARIPGLKLRIPGRSQPKFIHCERKRHALL